MDGNSNSARISMRGDRISLRSPNCNACFKVKITGKIDKNVFLDAVETVRKRHPPLNMTVDIDDDNNAWFIPGAGSVGVEFYDAGDGMDWEKWFEITDGIPFDCKNGPLVKIGVFSHPDTTEIFIVGNHALGDGIGYINLTRDLLRALDGRLDATPQIPFKGNSFRVKTKLGYFSKLYADNLNKAWRASDRKRLSEDDYRTFFKDYRKKYPPKAHFASIKEPELSKLLSACKKNRITVNEAIAAALIAAIQKSGGGYKEKPVRLSVAASIRNDLVYPDVDCMGNYVTAISIKSKYDEKKNFLNNTRRIAASLRKKLYTKKSRYLAVHFLGAVDADFLESALYAAYGDYDNIHSKKLAAVIGEKTENKGFGLTNLGKQDFGAFDNFRLIDILLIPPVYPAHIMNISVMTVNGEMRFGYGYSDTDIGDAQVEAISFSTIEYLLKII